MCLYCHLTVTWKRSSEVVVSLSSCMTEHQIMKHQPALFEGVGVELLVKLEFRCSLYKYVINYVISSYNSRINLHVCNALFVITSVIPLFQNLALQSGFSLRLMTDITSIEIFKQTYISNVALKLLYLFKARSNCAAAIHFRALFWSYFLLVLDL